MATSRSAVEPGEKVDLRRRQPRDVERVRALFSGLGAADGQMGRQQRPDVGVVEVAARDPHQARPRLGHRLRQHVLALRARHRIFGGEDEERHALHADALRLADLLAHRLGAFVARQPLLDVAEPAIQRRLIEHVAIADVAALA